MTQITLRNLTKSFDDGNPAVHEVSLQVDNGELLALVGPSGAGKTTILRMVAGLENPDSGDVLFDGNSVTHVSPEKRGAVMVFQSHALFPFMSVGDNVAYGLRRRGVKKAEIVERVMRMLEIVQLPDFADRWPDQLSGGQQQRIALARALVVKPNVLLLDEPFSSLDPKLREELRQTIADVRRDYPVTTLFVTHDQTEAVSVADRIALITEGTVRQVGAPRDFYDRPVDVETARFFGGMNFILGMVEEDGMVRTDIGRFPLQHTYPTNTPIILTIRPEAIQLGGSLRGIVHTRTDLGNRMRCCVVVQGMELYLDLPPHSAPVVGNTISLQLALNQLHPVRGPL